LLAVLGTSGEHGWSREKLIALLWPDTEPTEARRRLSQSVYLLRQAMGEASLTGLGETLVLNRDLVAVDLDSFKAAAEGGRWDQAAEAYAGPFLDGFFIRNSGPFEEWADSERRRLADMYATCLEAAATESVERNDHLRAAERWRRLIEHDPYNSRAVVGLMEALSAAGDPGNALLVAEEHAETLREDLGLGCGADVEMVVERIRESLPAAEPGTPRPVRRLESWPSLETAPEEESRVSRRVLKAVVALALMVAGAWLTVWFAGMDDEVRVSLDPALVAVLPFENASGDPALDQWVVAASGRVAAELDATGHVGVAEQAAAADAWNASRTRGAGTDIESWITTVSARLGAGLLVSGEYYAHGDSIHFQARVVDASKGRVVSELGPYSADLRSATAALDVMSEQVTIHVIGPQYMGMREGFDYSDLPVSFPALQEFIESKRHTQGPSSEWDFDLAVEHLRRAIALDSTWDWAWGRALIGLINMQQFAAADSVRAVMESRKSQLPMMQRVLQLPVGAAVLDGDRLGLLRAYRNSQDAFDGPVFDYLVAFGAQLNNRPHECLEAMDYPGGEDPWDTLPWCLHALGLYDVELDTVRWGRRDQPNNVQLLEREARALAALGRAAEVRNIVDESRSAVLDPEYRFRLEVDVGLELRAHGKPDAGQEAVDRGVAWYEARPDSEVDNPHYRYTYARALYAARRWADAVAIFRSLRQELVQDSTMFTRSNPTPSSLPAHHNMDVALLGYEGTLAARLGETGQARAAAALLQELDRRFLWGDVHYWRAAIAAVLGERDRAVDLLAEALSAGLTWYGFGPVFGSPKWDFHIDPDFESLRGYPRFEVLTGPQD
jgi:DNA-binding SARP family transcriptional activator/TolB-like protein